MNIISKIKDWNHKRLERRNERKRQKTLSYVSEVSPDAPYVFVSYIPRVFYLKDPKELLWHQNMREQMVMVKVLNELGYNVYVSDYLDGTVPAGLNCKAVFGIFPLLDKAMEQYPHALKIYYGTTAYWQHQERMTIERTDAFNRKHGAEMPYERLPEHSDGEQKSDFILQIGSRYTIDTYPEALRSKITLIHQSTTVETLSLSTPASRRTDYIWFGSSGNVLKGLDLVFDYFISHSSLTLHVVGGPFLEEFLAAYGSKLTSNIRIHGWMDVWSSEFQSVVSKCAFMVFPSCSEGCPGGVLAMMKLGVIPIVSPYAAFDGIEHFGYVMSGLDDESMEKGIDWAQSLTAEEKDRLSEAGSRFVADTFNLAVYEEELRRYFSGVLPKVK
ncbi:MAG: glycosyltransferase [Paraprevotella sp.]|nr:glycosyltransferase [Paraprevotella sp.]